MLLGRADFVSRLEKLQPSLFKDGRAICFDLYELGRDEIDAFIRRQLRASKAGGGFAADEINWIADLSIGDPVQVNRLSRLMLELAGGIRGSDMRATARRNRRLPSAPRLRRAMRRPAPIGILLCLGVGILLHAGRWARVRRKDRCSGRERRRWRAGAGTSARLAPSYRCLLPRNLHRQPRPKPRRPPIRSPHHPLPKLRRPQIRRRTILGRNCAARRSHRRISLGRNRAARRARRRISPGRNCAARRSRRRISLGRNRAARRSHRRISLGRNCAARRSHRRISLGRNCAARRAHRRTSLGRNRAARRSDRRTSLGRNRAARRSDRRTSLGRNRAARRSDRRTSLGRNRTARRSDRRTGTRQNCAAGRVGRGNRRQSLDAAAAPSRTNYCVARPW